MTVSFILCSGGFSVNKSNCFLLKINMWRVKNSYGFFSLLWNNIYHCYDIRKYVNILRPFSRMEYGIRMILVEYLYLVALLYLKFCILFSFEFPHKPHHHQPCSLFPAVTNFRSNSDSSCWPSWKGNTATSHMWCTSHWSFFS